MARVGNQLTRNDPDGERGLIFGSLFFCHSTEKFGIGARLRLPLRRKGVNHVQHKGAKLKVLARKNQLISFPRFALVKSRIIVPSSDAFMRVSNATVREGRSGRVWPPDVLRKFQTAEIITETSINHYVLRDTSISPVRSV